MLVASLVVGMHTPLTFAAQHGHDPLLRLDTIPRNLLIASFGMHCRTAYSIAEQTANLFPKDLDVVWESLPEDDAPHVDDVVNLVVRLEDRLRAGQKVRRQTRALIASGTAFSRYTG